MAFTSDTTRTWGGDFETLWGEPLNPSLPLSESNCDGRYYRAFWINAIRWLAAGKIGKTNDAVTLELAQGYALPNQPVAARVKVRGNQSRDISGAEVSLVLSAGNVNVLTNDAKFDPATLAYVTELRPTLAGNHRGSRNVASSRRGCPHVVTDTANGACARRRHRHPAASTVHPFARGRQRFRGGRFGRAGAGPIRARGTGREPRRL